MMTIFHSLLPAAPVKSEFTKNYFFVKRKIALFQLPKEFYHSFHMAASFSAPAAFIVRM